MDPDLGNLKVAINEILMVCEKNMDIWKKGIASSDAQTLINSYCQVFEVLYAAKYQIWKASHLQNWSSKLKQEERAELIVDLVPPVERLRKELDQLLAKGSVSVGAHLSKKELRKLHIHLDSNFGSGKYAVDLN